MFDLYVSTRYGSIAPNFPTTLNPGSFRGFFIHHLERQATLRFSPIPL